MPRLSAADVSFSVSCIAAVNTTNTPKLMWLLNELYRGRRRIHVESYVPF